jgi:hypothetical protein
MRTWINRLNAGLAQLGAPFPLTPALSLGERGLPSTAVETFQNAQRFDAATTLTPSPWGEGRGEGDRGLQCSVASASNAETGIPVFGFRAWFGPRASAFGFFPA